MQLALTIPDDQNTTRTVEVSDYTFGTEFNEGVVHQVCVAYAAGGRTKGTQCSKDRSSVKGSSRKLWRQKGTGRARVGNIRNPLWRGGGHIFAARGDRNYTQKVNKQMRRLAMRSIYSELVRQKRLHLVEDLKIEQPKTKALVAKLNAMGVTSALILVDKIDSNLYLSARNIPGVNVKLARSADPVSLIKYPFVIATVAAVREIEESLKND